MQKQEFLRLNINYNNYSWRELGQLVNRDSTTISNWLREENIKKAPVPAGSRRRKLSRNGEIEKLVNDGYSSKQISEKLNLTTRQITCYRNVNKISGSLFGRLELTDVEKQVILGSILGDGTIEVNNKQRQYHRLSINHSINQRDYMNYKYSLLKNIATAPTVFIKKDRREKFHDTESIVLRTMVHPIFKKYREDWYNTGKKGIYQRDFQNIEGLGLAIWYMDDGCFAGINPILCTDSFTLPDIDFMRNVLKQKFDIVTTLQAKNRICILAQSREKFFTLIKPYMHQSMMYKITNKVKSRSKQNLKQ